jgi:hypothetical protein
MKIIHLLQAFLYLKMLILTKTQETHNSPQGGITLNEKDNRKNINLNKILK